MDDRLNYPQAAGSRRAPDSEEFAPIERAAAVEDEPSYPLSLTPSDHDELQKLWEQNRRWVAALLLAHKPRWAEVDDLLQEVAATLVSKGHEIRDAGALKPWRRTVATNVARLAARRGKLRLHGSLDAAEEENPTGGPADTTELRPVQAATQTEEASRLLELAKQLPDVSRAAAAQERAGAELPADRAHPGHPGDDGGDPHCTGTEAASGAGGEDGFVLKGTFLGPELFGLFPVGTDL